MSACHPSEHGYYVIICPYSKKQGTSIKTVAGHLYEFLYGSQGDDGQQNGRSPDLMQEL